MSPTIGPNPYKCPAIRYGQKIEQAGLSKTTQLLKDLGIESLPRQANGSLSATNPLETRIKMLDIFKEHGAPRKLIESLERQIVSWGGKLPK